MIVGGAFVASIGCIFALIWPTELPALLVAVGGVAVGVGPSYAMTISMAKERQQLTSVDSAMFSVASSLGAGGVPFLMSRVLSMFGHRAFFPTLLGMSLALVLLTKMLERIFPKKESGESKEHRKSEEHSDVFSTEEEENSTISDSTKASEAASEASEDEASEEPNMPVPPLVWTYWEQGWENAPLICQICAESWELANPELTLHKVSATDLPALLPQLCRWDRLWELPAVQRSDIVRLALLQKFGGIWVDATLFSSAPVMPWLENLKAQQLQRKPSNSEVHDDFFFVFERDSENWPYDPFVKCKLPFLGCLLKNFLTCE